MGNIFTYSINRHEIYARRRRQSGVRVEANSVNTTKDFSLLKLAVEANSDGKLDVIELVKYLTIYPAKILSMAIYN